MTYPSLEMNSHTHFQSWLSKAKRSCACDDTLSFASTIWRLLTMYRLAIFLPSNVTLVTPRLLKRWTTVTLSVLCQPTFLLLFDSLGEPAIAVRPLAHTAFAVPAPPLIAHAPTPVPSRLHIATAPCPRTRHPGAASNRLRPLRLPPRCLSPAFKPPISVSMCPSLSPSIPPTPLGPPPLHLGYESCSILIIPRYDNPQLLLNPFSLRYRVL
jgi:hypothetical protein